MSPETTSENSAPETPEETTPEAPELVEFETVKAALEEIFYGRTDAELTRRFQGGKLIIQPANEKLSPKEIPIEEFFKKIVRVRDQLRVLEQKINNNDQLSESDKSTFRSYVTRSYGALTSFNLLFAEKSDQFRGQSSKS